MMRKNGHRLLDPSGKAGIITPLVDVLFNLMITMFIFLMIYMVVVLPTKPALRPLPVQLVKSPLPVAAPFIEYLSRIRTTNGSGRLSYICVPRAFNTNEGVLDVNRESGEISALFTRGEEAGRTVELDVLVVDSGMTLSVPTNHAVAWSDGRTNAYLYFHEDRPPSEVTALTNQNARSPGSNEVLASCAVRATLSIKVAPSAIPFNPAENPLRLVGPAEATGVEGVALETFVVPSGGIPPYEFRLEGAPDWLKLDTRTGKLNGVPPRSGRLELRMLVKDGQTPPARWDQADQLKSTRGHPLVTASVELLVRPQMPLAAKFMLPVYGRVGEAFSGTVIATGGVGRRTFAPESLPGGLNLNPDSGEITGIPGEKGPAPIIVTVSDEANHQLRVVSSTPQWRGIIEPRPRPAIWGSQMPNP